MAGDRHTEMTRQPQERTIWALRRAALAVDALKERRLRGAEVTGSQYSVLMSVLGEPGISGAELARRMQVSPQAVAPLVRRLQELGFLDRRPHPQHAHVHELRVTAAGRAALHAVEPVVEDLERQIEKVLGTQETLRLRRLLEAVAEYAWKQK
jgi:DNA-binding MarR family transcriptional regulator